MADIACTNPDCTEFGIAKTNEANVDPAMTRCGACGGEVEEAETQDEEGG